MGKQKLTPEEKARARQEKINNTLNSFNVQLMQLGKQKGLLLSKLTEARRLGLKVQDQQARGLLGSCLAQEKRVLGMQMQLELAVQSRDLSNLEQSFLDCVSEMSDEVATNVTKAKIAKGKKKYMKSLYNINAQNERMDEMLKMGDAAINVQAEGGKFTEFDEQIDLMVQEFESGSVTTNRNKQLY